MSRPSQQGALVAARKKRGAKIKLQERIAVIHSALDGLVSRDQHPLLPVAALALALFRDSLDPLVVKAGNHFRNLKEKKGCQHRPRLQPFGKQNYLLF
jgi:hypothetical protein